MSPEKNKDCVFFVIPNTHWDREWLYDFQHTRMLLVQFLDKLLKIFNQFPEYKSYLLDAQTAPIEDYLEIRPEKQQEITDRIREKRLFIGPWYTLPEEHLVNGESLIRNLLIGHRMANYFGGIMKVGYSPFSYGQASQMPQIYQGFGIDTILFYHGITHEESEAEFIFEGPDGSQLLASRMGSNARYNFFFSVYRPAVFGKKMAERDYLWHEKGLPFHLCSEDRYQEHHFLLEPVKQLHKEDLPDLMREFKLIEVKHSTTPNIACMQGMDSTQPDEFELKTIEQAAKALTGKDVIKHSNLPEWIEAIKSQVKKEDLVILKGERRTPRQLGTRVHLYGDVTSARTLLKRKNTLAEYDLQRKAEPFATVTYLLGYEYPKTYLDRAWKYLLQCHPHDSIAGTGVDQIEKDMHYRLDQCRNISTSLLRQSLQDIQRNINNANITENAVILTVFNPAPYRRDEVVTAVLDLPRNIDFRQYGITDALSGDELTFQEEYCSEHAAVVRHLGDATMELQALRVRIHIPITEIPALGYVTLIVKPRKTFSHPHDSLVTGLNRMENAYVKVIINPNGTLDVEDKATGHVFKGLHYFEDSGEAGHAWRHIPPAFNRILTTLSSNPKIELILDGPFMTRFLVTYNLSIPAHLVEGTGDYIRRLDGDGDDARRSPELVPLGIKSEFTLTKFSKGIRVKTTFSNKAEDHRIRIMFPTHLSEATFSSAEEPFDVVDRIIDRDTNNPWQNTWNPTHPHQRFVDVSNDKVGLAIINDGLREYEVSDDTSRTIGITLVRAFELALTTVAWRWERHPEMKGSQSLGEHEFRYFIYPHAGDWDKGGVSHQADIFNVSLETGQAGPYSGGNLPKSLSFFELAPNELMLSCIKRAEDRDSIMVRIFNPTNQDKKGYLKIFRQPKKVKYVNLNEESLTIENPTTEQKEIHFAARAKKIVTLELIF